MKSSVDLKVSNDLKHVVETKSMGAINKKTTYIVIVLCWFAILFEGYDLLAYGVTVPSLMNPQGWGLSPTTAGAIGSLALLGMFFGSILGGVMSDKAGRRYTIILFTIYMSVVMGLCATAPTPNVFAFYRFLAGLGVGALIQPAVALTTEYSPVERRTSLFVIMYSGFAFGGVAASLSGVLFLQHYGWRMLFWLGSLPLVLIPVYLKFLPESLHYLLGKNKQTRAEEVAQRYQVDLKTIINEMHSNPPAHKNALKEIFSPKYLKTFLIFTVTYSFVFLLIYSVNTWLPKLMQMAGFMSGSSMAFLLVFNLSAVFGSILAAMAADRWGLKKVIVISYISSAIGLALIGSFSNAVILYILIGIAGFGTTGTTTMLASYLIRSFAPEIRGTASGLSSGIARIGSAVGPVFIGYLMSLKFTLPVYYYIFALLGIVSAMLVLSLPKANRKI